MTEYSPEAKALIEEARRALEPGEDELARVRRGVAARLDAGAPAGTQATMVGLKTLALVGVLLTGMAGGAWLVGRDRRAGKVDVPAPVSSASVAAAVTARLSSPPQTSAPAQPPAAPSSASVDRGASRAAPSSQSSADTLVPEIALMRRAESALAGGDPSDALELLNEHAATFPHGALAEEREATRILALCALGRTAEARTAARRFERAAPRSIHLPRIHASCAGAGAGP